MRAATVCPAGIDTPWWGRVTNSSREERRPDDLLAPEEVAEAILSIAAQPAGADDIESIVLRARQSPVVVRPGGA